MSDRREFVCSMAAIMAAVGVAPVRRAAAEAAQAAAPAADATARLNALFDAFMEERFAKEPERLTSLGLDKGKYAGARARLDDASLAAARDFKRDNAARLQRLRALPRDGLHGADLANYDTVAYQMETIARSEPFDYGELGYGFLRPYVVSQLTGAYQSIPTFLDRQHPVQSIQDAEDYLQRLHAFAQVLDQESERVKHDAALKVIAPDFLIDRTLEQMRALLATPAGKSILTTSVATRAGRFAGGAGFAARAERIVQQEIYPALDRQARLLAGLRPQAQHEAGVQHLPQGEALYALALRVATTTDMSAAEVHQLGQEQAREISAQMETLLRSQGRTSGTLAQRVEALGRDPQFLFSNDDAGRQKVLDYCNGLIRALQPHLPRYFRLLPKAPVEIRRVPAYIEAGAPGGYYQGPPLDGSRPGAFYINLRDTSEWARWKLPTLVYHESEPGHHFQIALVLELPNLPLIRKSHGGLSANTEGWALYAEQLCDEMGMYSDDPLGRLGMLQSALFRAARCVVDTGLHSKGWSREQAIDYMVGTTGEARSAMTTEVERYCTWPGQATSYKVGCTRWLALREQARRRLGARFDIRDFHDVGLSAAPMPLAVLERVVADWLHSRA